MTESEHSEGRRGPNRDRAGDRAGLAVSEHSGNPNRAAAGVGSGFGEHRGKPNCT